MKTSMRKLKTLLLLTGTFLMIAYMVSCKKDKETDAGTAHVTIRMTDKPIAGLKEVNIDIKSVEYHVNAGGQTSGWQSVSTISGIFNILKLVNGFDTVIAAADIPTGKISQIRLILGSNNTIKDSLGNIYALSVPSGSESGLKIQVHETLNKDLEYTFLLDFDAAKSIVTTGTNTYILKPVIRLVSTVNTGSIKGVIRPIVAKPMILAINGVDTSSTTSDANGNYLIKGLNPGAYQLKIYPISPYPDSTLSGINVSIGVVTVVDTLNF